MKTQIAKFLGLSLTTLILLISTAQASGFSTREGNTDGNEKIADIYTVKIFNNKGSIVFEENAGGIIQNDIQFLGSLPDGYYTYQVIHGKEMVYRAIIAKNADDNLSPSDLPGNAVATIAKKDDLVLVRIFKENNSRARVVLTNNTNEVIYSRRTKKSGCQRITHDISKLPEGKYNMSVYNNGILVAERIIEK